MEDVKKYFRNKFNKTGIALTVSQLMDYVKRQKIKGVSKTEVSKFITEELHVARFAPVQKPKHFQTIGVLRPGVFFMDYADFRPDLKEFNDDNTGFLVSVQNVTNQLFVRPCGNKATDSWLRAIEQFVELTQNVKSIITDRDSVTRSANFQRYIMNKYGIKWVFLPKNSKSYLSERYIGFVKTKLSQALLHRESKRWVAFIEPLVKEYNKSYIEGTSYTRQSVNKNNFDHFLTQFLGTEQPELLFNAGAVSPFKTQAWNAQIFKFSVGEKVLLSKRAEWKSKHKYHAFTKFSTEGGFSDRVYTIGAMQLRKTKGLRHFVAVYALEEYGPSLHFYERELKKVNQRQVVNDNDNDE